MLQVLHCLPQVAWQVIWLLALLLTLSELGRPERDRLVTAPVLPLLRRPHTSLLQHTPLWLLLLLQLRLVLLLLAAIAASIGAAATAV